ncbi:MAG TPA: hypothetical protein VF063_03760 [Gaiellaceae bacterium]
MQTITIEAATPDSAVGLYEALSGFRVDLRETDAGRRHVEVELTGGNREIVDVLNAIADYVSHQAASGSTRLVLDGGRNYTLNAR